MGNVKMLLFRYSQLGFREGREFFIEKIAVRKILRNPKIELGVMK